MLARRGPAMAFLGAFVLIAAVAGCAVVSTPEGVVGGIDLPSDLSLVLLRGMPSGDVIARFGVPAKRTTAGEVTTLLYYEVYQPGHERLKLFGTPVGSDGATRTQLHLVFFDDALVQAWVEESGAGREPTRQWLVGAPPREGGGPALPP